MRENQNKLKEAKMSGSDLTLNDNNTTNLINTIDSCHRLLKLNKNRQLVKLPIMVKPYNATSYQMVNYIKELFEFVNNENINVDTMLLISEDKNGKFKNKGYYVYKKDKNIKLTINDLYLLVKTIEQVIYCEFPKLKGFNNYLNKVAEICSILNISITWAVPSGLNVNQYYLDSEAIRLKPFKYKKNTFTLKIRTKKINKQKQIRALMPNLVHSLDAASLSLIVNIFFNYNENINSEGINFFSIHDCFAVSANNVTTLIKIIKLVYIKIYSEDSYLKRFDQGIINSIKLQFGSESFDDQTKKIKVNGYNFDYPNVDEVIVGKIKANNIFNANYIIKYNQPSETRYGVRVQVKSENASRSSGLV